MTGFAQLDSGGAEVGEGIAGVAYFFPTSDTALHVYTEYNSTATLCFEPLSIGRSHRNDPSLEDLSRSTTGFGHLDSASMSMAMGHTHTHIYSRE